jgi:hypothetical protein
MWHFTEGTSELTIADLREIAGIFSLYKPKIKEFANKSAIIAPGLMNKAIGEIFVSMTRLLPVKYKVFDDIESAEAFLVS